jgi:hypothetical protein
MGLLADTPRRTRSLVGRAKGPFPLLFQWLRPSLHEAGQPNLLHLLGREDLAGPTAGAFARVRGTVAAAAAPCRSTEYVEIYGYTATAWTD